MDILRELSVEELEYILGRFKENLPYALKNLYYVYSALKCKRESVNYETLSNKVLPTFYTHRYGLKENCTVFGITGDENHTIWYFSFDEDLKEVKECIEKTELIKWSYKFMFVTLHSEQIQPVLDYINKNRLNIIENEENSYYWLPMESALKLQIEIPAEVKMTQLEATDASLCNTLWKYKNEKSELWIKSLIQIHGGYGLRDKNTNEILSFAIINDHMAIGVLTTVQKAQRKGYGEIVAKYLAKKIAENGLIPHVYINKENVQGFKLFNKIGFKKIGDSNWIVVG